MHAADIIDLLICLAYIAVLMFCAASDHASRLVPNKALLCLCAAALLHVAVKGLWLNLLGILPAVLFYAVCYRGGKGIGGADIKMLAVLGLFHGLAEGLAVLLAACVLALTVAGIMRVFKTRHREGIPLCFYMGIASAAWWLAGTGTVRITL